MFNWEVLTPFFFMVILAMLLNENQYPAILIPVIKVVRRLK